MKNLKCSGGGDGGGGGGVVVVVVVGMALAVRVGVDFVVLVVELVVVLEGGQVVGMIFYFLFSRQKNTCFVSFGIFPTIEIMLS